jgi:hypothetical protein
VTDFLRWAPAVAASASAAVSVIGGVASAVFWVRARGERREAAEQAKNAATSAETTAEAARQLTELRLKQDERQQVQARDRERDPWSIDPKTQSEAVLTNNTQTAKYGVKVTLSTAGQEFSEDAFDFVGPGRSKVVSFIEFGNAETKAVVTWHLDEDCHDVQPPQYFSW